MTKKIIIDDVDVNECEFYCYSGNHGELTHYCTYQKDEDGLDTHCNADFNKNCFYKKILRRLKRKEQECEQLRETIKLQNEIQKEVCEEKNKQIDQLKTRSEETIDGLLSVQYQLADNCMKYEQALQEIKRIAQGYKPYKVCGDYNNNCEPINEILQKCEVRINRRTN